MTKLAGARRLGRYWAKALFDAVGHTVPTDPRAHVREIALVAAAILILVIWIAPSEAGRDQVQDELRWLAASLLATVLVGLIVFLIQLIRSPLRLQDAAVAEALLEERSRRTGERRETLQPFLTRGAELRDDIMSMRDSYGSVDVVARNVRDWQDASAAAVERVAPNEQADFLVEAGERQPQFQPDPTSWPVAWKTEMGHRLESWLAALSRLSQ